MPNHIDTSLTVEGPCGYLENFRNKHIVLMDRTTYGGKPVIENGITVQDHVFDFNTITLCHKDLVDATSPARSQKDVKREEELLEKIKNTDYDIQEEKEKAIANKEKDIVEVKRQVALSESNLKKYGYANWYDFCIAEWGTKWGAYDLHIQSDLDEDPSFIRMSYNTAWSPALPIMEKLATMYPELTFTMSCLDEGMGFAGTCVWSEGELASEENYDGEAMYEFANEEFGHDYVKCPKCDAWMQDECWDCEMAD